MVLLRFATLGFPLRGRISLTFLLHPGTRGFFRRARWRRVGSLVLSLARFEIWGPALRSFRTPGRGRRRGFGWMHGPGAGV